MDCVDKQGPDVLDVFVTLAIEVAMLSTGEPSGRTMEGLSKKEIIRCLKRYVAREIYRILVPARELPVAA